MICPAKIGSDVTQFWQARYDSVQEFSRGESSHWELAGNFQGKIAAKFGNSEISNFTKFLAGRLMS